MHPLLGQGGLDTMFKGVTLRHVVAILIDSIMTETGIFDGRRFYDSLASDELSVATMP